MSNLLLADLAASGVKQIPSGYIRPISDRPNLSDVQISHDSIPLIDLHGLDGPSRSLVIKQISQACENDGFFQVKNHGIPEEMIGKITNIARQFFKLPESERLKTYSDDPTKTTRLSTSFNVNSEKISSWRDFLRLHCYPLEDYMHEWPCNPPSFRRDVAEYCTSIRGLVLRDTVIGPPEEMVDDDHPAVYRDFTYGEYYEKFWNRGLVKECCLDLFKASNE
ncbi:hypothetical protein OIU84_024101 [Salix udensis]|uniref:Non-haem dioxygenase N-terminal domain-containing protein n=1 Tax=Salix udensis TaxID=889485 RepID=A0AAD6PBM7_9ROSI|nr:hypothetical protein OIU84_024101 [Salix udensis]